MTVYRTPDSDYVVTDMDDYATYWMVGVGRTVAEAREYMEIPAISQDGEVAALESSFCEDTTFRVDDLEIIDAEE